MNTSKLILPFSCGKVNFSRSILLLKTGFYISEEIEVVCLLCLSDDKLPAETFWVICQMTNRSQRRFESFVRWQIARRDVLSHLSGDKSFPEAFWDERPLHFKKNDDLRVSPSWSFCLKGYFYGLPRWRSQWRVKPPLASPCPLLEFHKLPQSFGQPPIRGAKSARILFGRLAGGKIIDCHADARNDSLGTWVYKSFFTKIVSGGNLSKVFSRARG